MTLPTPPIPPTVTIPQWAYSGGVYIEPDLAKRQVGWVQETGQNYGEVPPYQWFNWLSYSAGEWINYFATGVIPYLQDGNFLSGINLYDQGSVKFYETDNTNYISFKAPTALVAGSNYTLPLSQPITTGQVLGSSTTGIMSWQYGGAGNPNPPSISAPGYNGGVRQGYIGEQLKYFTYPEISSPSGTVLGWINCCINGVPDSNPVLPAGIWDISALAVFLWDTNITTASTQYGLALSQFTASGTYTPPAGSTKGIDLVYETVPFQGGGLGRYTTLTIPIMRVIVTSPTTMYMQVSANFNAGVPSIIYQGGTFTATRVG